MLVLVLSKKRKEKAIVSGHEMHSALNRLASRISYINTKSEFDKTKVELIKLYTKIKQHPVLMEFDNQRVELLRECNINIQFLNRDEDVWNLISRGKIEDAYEEIIATTKAISDHPDRHYIKSWVSSQIRESLKKIADLAAALPKKKEDTSQTIMPKEFSSTDTPFSPLASNKTIKPQFDVPINPFAKSEFTSLSSEENPFDQAKPRTTATIHPSPDSATLFKPNDIASPFEKTFRPKNLTPASSESKTIMPSNPQAVQYPDDNSIKTFWIRDEKTKIQPSSSQEPENTPFKSEVQNNEADPFKNITKKLTSSKNREE
ncbi:hypothetical protein NEF87_003307 [Candidatus Lokiarchaeum ossiferum]|uniref:Uncharacterized protein n=1 Tax=Candidatus Lokiarchaeum ossiferum TaxID=2951803 RepID=A0ABY6HVZ1_9ARCH|nr:hypothetical protein NEF87_003307 [Candidatus Lokiarchaeum sp. B-35]